MIQQNISNFFHLLKIINNTVNTRPLFLFFLQIWSIASNAILCQLCQILEKKKALSKINEDAESLVRRCSVEKVFLLIS